MKSANNGRQWRKTRVNWETRKIIWKQWALGDTEVDTVSFFELNCDKYPKGPLHRHTISKVRQELLEVPFSILDRLCIELPEILALLKEVRPDYTGHHYASEFTITLLTIADNLKKIRNAPSDSLGDPFGHTVYTVGEKVYGGWWIYEDQAKLGDVDRKLAAELLKCLKQEEKIPELADISDWSELGEDQNTENLIQRLIARAHIGNIL